MQDTENSPRPSEHPQPNLPTPRADPAIRQMEQLAALVRRAVSQEEMTLLPADIFRAGQNE